MNGIRIVWIRRVLSLLRRIRLNGIGCIEAYRDEKVNSRIIGV